MDTTSPGRKFSQRLSSGLEKHLGYWLRRVSNHVSESFADALQAQHTSVAEWVVLQHLQDDSGAGPSDLADATGLTRGAISKVLDKLESKGWVARGVHEEDSRAQTLGVTPAGRRAIPKLASIANDNDAIFFACLSAGERRTLRALLQKIATSNGIAQSPLD